MHICCVLIIMISNTVNFISNAFVDAQSEHFVTYLTCDVIDDHRGRCPAVVHGRQAVIPLLARRVPDIKLNRGGIPYCDGFCQICS